MMICINNGLNFPGSLYVSVYQSNGLNLQRPGELSSCSSTAGFTTNCPSENMSTPISWNVTINDVNGPTASLHLQLTESHLISSFKLKLHDVTENQLTGIAMENETDCWLMKVL